jgi:hypothetical protein
MFLISNAFHDVTKRPLNYDDPLKKVSKQKKGEKED